MHSQVIYWTIGEAGLRRAGLTSDQLEYYLSEAETEQLRRFSYLKRREEWLIGRLTVKSLLQTCLSEKGEFPLQCIEIANQSDGAPYALINGQGLEAAISISHRNGMAAAAVCFDREVGLGIDLEWIEDRDNSFYIDYFTDDEQHWLRTQGSENISRTGTILWSAKESMLKAMGLGLRVDTRSVEVKRIGIIKTGGWGEIEIVSHLDKNSSWHGYFGFIGNHVVTIAALNLKSSPMLQLVTTDLWKNF